MASNFWNGEFYFDGIQSSVYKVCIVDISSGDVLKQVGSTFNMLMEKNIAYRGNPLYKEGERTLENITLQLCRTDGKPWSGANISEVVSWLFQDTFKKFQPTDIVDRSYNLIYYVKAISFSKYLNTNMEGYLEIVFQPYDAYVYAVPNNALTVGSGETRNINNLSNLNSIYYPKIKIINAGDTSNVITIRNQTNGKSLSLTNINKGEIITVDCAIGSVVDANGNNRFSVLKDYDFIGLNRGNNSISLSANCSAEFVCEFPMIM